MASPECFLMDVPAAHPEQPHRLFSPPGKRRSDLDLALLAATADLEDATAQEVIRWAVTRFPGRVALSQSMSNTALTHMVAQIDATIPVLFADTGLHFPETIAARNELQSRHLLPIVDVRPRSSLAQQAAEHGPDLHLRDPDLCCQLRKVAPMEEALHDFDVWITGLRLAAAPHRAGAKVVSFDEQRHLIKLAPVLHWTDEHLARYTLDHDVVVNDLVYQGYPSIGCAPCTGAVTAGGDPRGGRWAGTGKLECGLHR